MPLRQYLVISVIFGDSHHLPADLFSSDLVSRVVFGITGECPQRLFRSYGTDILLVFASKVDVNKVKVQMKYQSSWMGKPVHLQCVRPSGMDFRKFGVIGSVSSFAMTKECYLGKVSDASLELPFFSGNPVPEEDEVTFAQWRSAVEGAQFTSFPTAVHSWIFRSLRNPAAQVTRNQGVGASIKQILSKLNATYGNVLPFDVLMRQFLNVCQNPQESVTNYVARFEGVLSTIRENYPQQLPMVDKFNISEKDFTRGSRRKSIRR